MTWGSLLHFPKLSRKSFSFFFSQRRGTDIPLLGYSRCSTGMNSLPHGRLTVVSLGLLCQFSLQDLPLQMPRHLQDSWVTAWNYFIFFSHGHEKQINGIWSMMVNFLIFQLYNDVSTEPILKDFEFCGFSQQAISIESSLDSRLNSDRSSSQLCGVGQLILHTVLQD